MRYILPIFMLIFTCIPFSTQAQIIASDMEVRFPAQERAVKKISISNQSTDSTFVVNAEVVELTNPGEATPVYLPSKKVLAIPQRFTLTSEGSRNVRLISNTSASSKERIFKVRFIPEAPKEDISGNKHGVTPKLRIITAVGVLTSIAPQTPQENLTWERDGTGIKFTNNGNFNVVIARKEKCVKGICYQIPGKRLYSDASWHLKLPEALRFSPIKIEVFVSGVPKEVIIPYEY